MKAKNKFLLSFILVFSILVFLFISDVLAQNNMKIKEGIWNGEKIEYVEGQILVKLKPKAIMETVVPLIPEDKRIARDCEIHRWGLMEVDESVGDIFEEMELLKRNPAVEAVEPNMVGYAAFTPNDPYFYGSQWALNHVGYSYAGGNTAAHIHIIDGWDVYRQKQGDSSRVILAVLDTGISLDSLTLQPNHPDLNADRFILGIDCTGDGEGVRDRRGHGTHVTGIAAAETNNGVGIAGIFWGPVLVEQVFHSYTGWFDVGAFCTACYDALFYALGEGKRLVINFSGGKLSYSQSFEAMIHTLLDYHVVLVACVHNHGKSDDVCYPAKLSSYGKYPGHQNGYENVIAVGASTVWDKWAIYSNYDEDTLSVDVVAPGGSRLYYQYDAPPPPNSGCKPLSAHQDILSTTPPYYPFTHYKAGGSYDPVYKFTSVNPWCYEVVTGGYFPNTPQDYGHLAGTSMATPHVSGLAALILSVNNTLSAGEVRNIIKNSADSLPGESEYKVGAGRINAYQALLNTPGLSKPLTQHESTVVTGFELLNNYPNPFSLARTGNPETEVGYHLPEDCIVEISVYNTLGQRVAELVNGREKAGSYTVCWDGRNGTGEYVSSGLYLYQLRVKGEGGSERFTQTRKMLLLR